MWEVRPITADEALEFRERVSQGFGRDAEDSDEARERFAATFELDRTLAAFDGEEIVGTCAAFSLEVTVPGGKAVPMGGTTVITVRPTHRRRGVLRSMMDRHLNDVEERGEPLAGLWASEGSIYGRFGYGIATWNHETSIEASGAEFDLDLEGNDSLRLVASDEAARLVPVMYEKYRPARPGMLSRSQGWWKHRVFADLEEWREGKSAQRYVIYERDGESLGYAIYRQKSKWEERLAQGEVDVIEVIAEDAAAHSRLWSFLSNIDLFPKVEYWNLPIDDPLIWKVSDPRRVKRRLTECLWVRVMDVPVALGSRAYETDGEVVFQLTDPMAPERSATYRLNVVDGAGSCEETPDQATLAMDRDVLGHLYLGGGDAMAMAGAGRISGDVGAIASLDAIFRTRRAPWCPETF